LQKKDAKAHGTVHGQKRWKKFYDGRKLTYSAGPMGEKFPVNKCCLLEILLEIASISLPLK
jgi:hypothetical protein